MSGTVKFHQNYMFQPSTLSLANTYTTGQVMGGILHFPNFAEDSGGSPALMSLALLDLSNSMIAIDINFFSGPVTAAADKSAFTLSATDAAKWLGTISVVSANYASAGSAAAIATLNNIWMMLRVNKVAQPGSCVANKDLYVVLVARGSFTSVGAAGLVLNLGTQGS